MEVRFNTKFDCPESVRPHLVSVFAGEYDIPLVSGEALRIIDLGANCGAFSLWAAHRWPGAEILAYEPHPQNCAFFEENLKAFPRVRLHNYAVGTPGMRVLHNGEHNCGEASLHLMANNTHFTGQHVEVKSPLSLPPADIIKLDIEGCEFEVLKPLMDEGRSFSAIMLEWHSEDLRRACDALLGDYHLVGAEVTHPLGRGVARYLHRTLIKGLI